MTTKIQLKDSSTRPVTDFTGYQLMLLFQVADNTDGANGQSTLKILSASNAGAIDFVQDNIQFAPGNINLTVKAPAGNILLNKDVDQSTIIGKASFDVTIATTQVQLLNPVVPVSSIVNGRLLDLSGTRKMDEIQIIIFASVPATPDKPLPILSATTETGGYFFVAYPEGEFANIFAVVGMDVKDNKILIQTDKNAAGKNIFPQRLLLVLESPSVAEAQKASDDCGCGDINFYEQPRRILDEFSYYSIIRTSDPEIKAYSIKDDDEISLEELLSASPTSSNPIVTGIMADPVKVFGHPQLPPFQLPRITPISHLTVATPAVEALAVAAASPTTTVAGSVAPAPTAAASDDVLKKLKDVKIKTSVVRDFMDQYKILNGDNYIKLLEMNDALKINVAIRPFLPAPLGRSELNSANQVDWDLDPTIYQSTSIAYGHLLNYKQQWVADGYSLGDLVYSLPLAPGQKKQIVVFDWERRESASNSQDIDYEESLDNSLSRDRDINEIASGVVNEKLNGSSTSTVKSASAGLGAAIGPLVIGASGGISKSNSTATQNSMRDTAASDAQHLSDKTVQSANSVRSQRSTVIQTVSQGEKYEVSAESVANYNHCHALTIQYFEVLRHFKVQQRLVDAQECLFVPLPITSFDIDKARRWKEILLASLRDKSLKKAFNALQRVKDHWEHSDFPATTFAAENVITLSGSLKLKISLTCPIEKMVEETRHITRFSPYAETYDEKYTVAAYDETKWMWMQPLLGMNPSQFYDSYLKGQPNQDDIFRNQLGEKITQKIMGKLDFKIVDDNGRELPITIDASLASAFHNNVPLAVSLRAGGTGIPREKFIYLKISLRGDLTLPDYAEMLVTSGSMNYRTTHLAHSLFTASLINDDLGAGDSTVIYCGPNHDELRNPKEEDVESVNELIHHLNSNLEYYHKMIWLYMTPERRFMLLDGINLYITKEQKSRSVASVVMNKLIGIVGNSLVLPVIPGLNLNPDFSPQMLNESTGEIVPLVNYYQHEPLDPLRISVPTKGVFAEAMMGQCNSCEIKDEQRFWRWEESPIPDSPTAIAPIVTPTPTVTQPNLQAAPLANPVVNIQNAPAAPDPQGLSGVLNLLGKSDTFRDVTGLAANQSNALAGLQSSFDTTKQFGQMGLDLRKATMQNNLDQQKLQADNDMRQSKLNTMADLYKSGKINKDDFDKYMADEGMSPDLKNAKDTNAAAKNGDITPDQSNALGPKTTPQTIAELQQKADAIQNAVANGSMTPEKGKELIGKLYGDALNGASDKGYTPDDIAAMTKAVKDNGVGSLTAGPGGVTIGGANTDQSATTAATAQSSINETPNERTFDPANNIKTGVITLNAANTFAADSTYRFHWGLENGLGFMGEAGVEDITKGDSSTWKYAPVKQVDIFAINPGIYKVNLNVAQPDPASGNYRPVPGLDTIKMVGVPQFVVVELGDGTTLHANAGSSAYTLAQVFTANLGANVSKAKTFDGILDIAGLTQQKDYVLYTMTELCEKLLSTVNVRIIWNLPLKSGSLMEDKVQVLSKRSNLDSSFEDNCITHVYINGYSSSRGGDASADNGGLFGVTYNTSVRIFNENIDIFPGDINFFSYLNSATSTNPSKFTASVYRILKAIDDQKTLLVANAGNQAIIDEITRLTNLWTEVFARTLGHTIAHEICHSLLGMAGGLDSGGHTPGSQPENLLTDFPRTLASATGIDVLNDTTFPADGSYTAFESMGLKIDEIQFLLSMNTQLQTQLNTMYAVPPTPPFDK